MTVAVLLSGWAASRPGSLPAVKRISFSELSEIIRSDTGSPLLINAWATWCKPCREEMPALLKVWKKHANRPFRLILLSADDVGDLETKVRPALRDFGIDFTTYIMSDTADDAFISGLNASWSGALPATFVYDRKGTQVDMKVGGQSFRRFEEIVSKVLRR